MDDLFGGIVIQRMVNADYAGVMFTKNPVNNDDNCIVIESCKGVASKLVDNIVVPDRYFIDQNTLEINSEFNNISKDKISELCEIGKSLKTIYGCNVDIEWACEKNVVLQRIYRKQIKKRYLRFIINLFLSRCLNIIKP